MSNPSSRQPISSSAGIDSRRSIDKELNQEAAGKGNSTVHGIPPFTVPRADGTLEASPEIQSNNEPRTATARMMRRRQNEISRGDQDGDGNYTNQQGHRDGKNQNDPSDKHDGSNRAGSDRHGSGSSGSGGLAGYTSRRPFLQRIRKAFMPTLIGGILGWYYDATSVLIYRTDARIKGNLLTFSLLCLMTMLSIFFYLEFIRPRVLKRPTVYVNWEKELLYPVRIATASLVMGVFGSIIALWPVWHLSTIFVLTAIAVAIVNVLGIFFLALNFQHIHT